MRHHFTVGVCSLITLLNWLMLMVRELHCYNGNAEAECRHRLVCVVSAKLTEWQRSAFIVALSSDLPSAWPFTIM